ncbi:nitrite reductase [NAD(P)H] large subunit [Vibrio astriarenae]|nr:nitrite reductase [NAD(P)H] large subunit [Vibrio sp. C7]
MSKMKLVVIGNGMVGHRYLEDLVDKTDVSNLDITVFVKSLASLTTVYTFLLTFLTTPLKSFLSLKKVL